jgi:putative membrane protein
MHYYNVGWWGWLMVIPMLLFWGLVIWGIVALLRRSFTVTSGTSASGETAIEVLKKRYARGEISTEEYEEKRRDLER